MTQILQSSDERPAMLEGFCLGIEAAGTPGVAVDIDTQIRSLSAQMRVEANVAAYKFKPSRYMSTFVQGREWASAPASGFLTYTEFYLVADSTHGKASATADGTLPKKRTYSNDPGVAADPQTYSFGSGSSYRGERYAGGIFNGYRITINQNEVALATNILAQEMEDGYDLAGQLPLTLIAIKPVLPRHCYVKMADTFAGLGAASKLRRVFECVVDYPGPWGPINPVSDSNTSIDGYAELEAPATISLTMSRRTAEMALLTTLRNSAVKYFEVGMVGAEIETGKNYHIIIQAAAQITKAPEWGETQGLASGTWVFGVCPQSDMDPPYTLEIENEIA